MALILGAILALTPLLIAPHLLFYFDVTPKIMFLVFSVALALPWFAARGRIGSLVDFGTGRLFAILLATQFASLLLSTAVSTNRSLSLGGTNWRRFGLVTQAAVLVFTLVSAAELSGRPRLTLSYFRLIASAGALAAAYGIAQYFGWDPLLPSSAYHVGGGPTVIVRPPGTLGHSGYFAAYLLAVTFIGAGLGFMESRLRWKLLGCAAAGLSAVAIVLSGTRAAMLGLIAGAVVMAFALRKRIPVRKVLAGLAAAAIGGMLFYYSGPGAQLRSRARWFAEDPGGGARLLLWRDALVMSLRGRLAIGYGPETFASEFPPFQSVSLARAYPDFFHESPHNLFLDAQLQQGLPGLIILAALCGLGVWAARRALAREPVAAAAALAAFVASIVSLLFTCFISVTALYFYFLVALLVALAAPGDAQSQQGPSLDSRRRRSLLAVAALVPAVVFAWFGIRLLLEDMALAQARLQLDSGAVSDAVRQYERSVRLHPAGEGTDLWFSRALWNAAGSRSATERSLAARLALSAGLRAIDTATDRHNAWYSLAGFYAAQGDYANMVMSLRSAIHRAPNWFKPHWTLARALALAGRHAEAEREARTAFELDAGRDADVALTWKQLQPGPK